MPAAHLPKPEPRVLHIAGAGHRRRLTSQALDTFQQAGTIASIEYDKITIKGKDYRPGSGVEVISDDATRSSFNAFKKGDLIYVEGTLLNGTRYVDIIRYETPDEN